MLNKSLAKLTKIGARSFGAHHGPAPVAPNGLQAVMRHGDEGHHHHDHVHPAALT